MVSNLKMFAFQVECNVVVSCAENVPRPNLSKFEQSSVILCFTIPQIFAGSIYM